MAGEQALQGSSGNWRIHLAGSQPDPPRIADRRPGSRRDLARAPGHGLATVADGTGDRDPGAVEMDGEAGREILTILFTDVEGSTGFRARVGDGVAAAISEQVAAPPESPVMLRRPSAR